MSGSRREPGAASRGLAARAVAQVLEGRTLDEALAGAELGAIPPADRAQVRALAFGALRWHHRHRVLLRELLDRPLAPGERLLEALLSVGMFQLLDPEQPDYAAVSATVEAARWLGRARVAGLVNATLRRLQRERERLLEAAFSTAEGRWSHPAWLAARLQADWPSQWQSVLEANQRRAPLWLRVNGARTSAPDYAGDLDAAGLGHRAGELPGALRLARPVPVSEIPGFTGGAVTVQDQASQLAANLLAPAAGMRVLDACAAPGGKTTHLLELAGGALDLTALDLDPNRLARLHESLGRLGFAARVVAGDAREPASWWDGRPFDRILVDAPCSGTGVIRRHPDIKWLRRESDIAPFASRQLAILAALWPLLAPSGRLLYVTCSVLDEENGMVIRQFRAAHPEAALLPAPMALPGWVETLPAGGWQALPGGADTDGLYYALMTRTHLTG